MLVFITKNISTIIICAVLIAAVTAIVANLIKNKRNGKSSCGCGCSSCPASGSCHGK